MSVTRLRALKLRTLLRHPNYWRPFLSDRVLATSEFHGLPFLPGIRTLIDVGANRGQFALFARERFVGATLHMFEPVAEAAAVARRVVPEASLYEVAPGAAAGTVAFHVHPDSDQSSILPVEGAGVVEAPIRRLDEMGTSLESRVLLKLDAQGAELDVLRGASGILDRVDQVLCELSAAGYIDGAPTSGEVVDFLAAEGFRPLTRGPILPYGTDVLFGRPASTP